MNTVETKLVAVTYRHSSCSSKDSCFRPLRLTSALEIELSVAFKSTKFTIWSPQTECLSLSHVYNIVFFSDEEVETYDINKVPKDILDSVEADTFWCMTRLLNGIQVFCRIYMVSRLF